MSDTYVETVPFESKYAWILENANAVRGARVAHRIPTDVIIDLGQLNCGCILDRPATCTPYNPAIPEVITEINKVNQYALVKSAVIPPLPYPETFGAILKEQNERWVAVRAELDVVYENVGDLTSWILKWGKEDVEELTPDDFLLMLAKETIQDNAKQEYVRVYNSDDEFIGFATYVDRTKYDRNMWKEQYVLKNLGLPIYLKPKAYQPTTTSGSVTFEDEDDETVKLTATLEGADKIIYKDDVGSGEEADRAGSKDTEAMCRCYTINAIVKPYAHVLVTPLGDALTAGRPTTDDIYSIVNWNNIWFNFILAGITIPAIGETHSSVNTCVAIEYIEIDGQEATLLALHDLLATATGGALGDITAETVCTDAKRFLIAFPLDSDGKMGAHVITLGLVWIYKVDIMKMDILVNDDLISHLYCGEGEEMTPPATPYRTVPSVWIESVNEFSS